MELILASIADDLGRSGSFCCVWHGESVLAIPTDLIPKVFGSFQQYRPETGRLESSSAQMELGALAHSRLSMSQQLALGIQRANSISGCVSGSTARRSRKVITSLCSAHVGVHLEHSLQLWAPRVNMGWSTSPMRGARLGKGMALGMPNSSLPPPLEAYEKTGPGCSQWCLAEGGWWWAEIETTEVQTGHKESFFNIRTSKFCHVVPREAENPGRFFKTWLLKALTNLV